MTRRLLFDVTGLVHWYTYFSHPSGIQRVIEKLLNSAAIRQSSQVEFVARALGSDTFYRIDIDTLVGLDEPTRRTAAIARLRAIFAKGMQLSRIALLPSDMCYYHLPYICLGLLRLDPLIEAWFARRLPAALPPLEAVQPPGPRDTLFNTGDLWWQKQYAPFLLGLKARTGVHVVQMVHDLFTIEHPEWFPPSLARVFTSDFQKVAPHVDRWLTNSKFVTGQLTKYLRGRALRVQPITVLPMGWDSFEVSQPDDPQRDQTILQRYGVADRPYILFVGTLEPRKNLATLLDALESLRGEFGSLVPDLVIVGGHSWRTADIQKRLRKDRSARWIKGVVDADLGAFYRGARFTVAPSHTEGWGLPVQESIAHGVPCIASTGGALREASYNLATHFDPSEPDSLKAAIAAWITDDGAVYRARARIKRTMQTEKLPTWNDAGRVLLKLALERTS